MEEKTTRISEVLLGPLSPFELMAGKLLGVIGGSVVPSALYPSGAYALRGLRRLRRRGDRRADSPASSST